MVFTRLKAPCTVITTAYFPQQTTSLWGDFLPSRNMLLLDMLINFMPALYANQRFNLVAVHLKLK